MVFKHIFTDFEFFRSLYTPLSTTSLDRRKSTEMSLKFSDFAQNPAKFGGKFQRQLRISDMVPARVTVAIGVTLYDC